MATKTNKKVAKLTTKKPVVENNNDYAIEIIDIHKSFLNGKVIANDGINLNVKRNEIHAIIGENGAGKSTLMSILFGIYTQDSGTIKVNGKPVYFNSAKDASAAGLGMVHQHFKLVPTYTVYENVILGSEQTDKFGVLKHKEARKKLQELIRKYKFNVSLNSKAMNLTVGQQQKTEILKLLYRDSDILIFDEPTAVLSQDEIEQFLNMLLDFKKAGKTIIIITHKFGEIKQVADRATVIRHGKYICDFDVKSKSIAEMSELMVGKKIAEVRNNTKLDPNAKKILEVKNLRIPKQDLPNTLKFNLKYPEVRRLRKILSKPITTDFNNKLEENLNVIKEIFKGKLTNEEIKIVNQIYTYGSLTKEQILTLDRTAANDLFHIITLDVIKEENGKYSIIPGWNAIIKQKIGKWSSLDEIEQLKRSFRNKINKEIEIAQCNFENNPDKTKNSQKFSAKKSLLYNFNKEFSSSENNIINFDIKAGEVFAIAGVEGNGQSELALILSGLMKAKHAEIKLLGEDISELSIKKRKQAGMSHIPEDRHKHGLVLDLPIYMNTVSNTIDQKPFSKAGFLNFYEIKEFARALIKKYDVRGTTRGTAPARLLSGGNQQKLIIGRELTSPHELVILVQPTRGLDLGAIEYVHYQIMREKEKGKAVLLISYELDEILSLADTIAVMYNNTFIGMGDKTKMTKAYIGQLMAGKD